MVDFDAEGRVRLLIEKPYQSDLRYSWCTAVWTPAFTEFIHQYLTVIEAGLLRMLVTIRYSDERYRLEM